MKLHVLYTPGYKMIDSPSLQLSETLIGQLRHLHVLEVTLNLIDSSRGQQSA